MALELGSKSEAVRAIQEMLNFLGAHVDGEPDDEADYVPLVADGEFGKRTEAAVCDFQSNHSLLADGKVGPLTLRALEREYRSLVMALASPGVDSLDAARKLVFERAPADRYGEGYDKVWLRSDVAERYRAMHAEVRAKGAVLTSSGAKRDLMAAVSAGRSATSFHYTGRALDLFIYSGMVDPQRDPYVVVREAPRVYRVFARCSAAQAEKQNLQRVVTYRRRAGDIDVTGSFVDLTAIFERHGFRSIRARPSFETGGALMGAEWWHFQDETGLIRGVSTFGKELLEVYSKATLERSPPWRYRDSVFGVNWQ